MISIEGLNVVVTGGNRGIGLGLAEGMAKAGANIAIWARNSEHNASAVAKLSSYGVKAFSVQCDVADENQVDEAMQKTIETLGPLGCFVANAGIVEPAPLVEMSFDTWRRTLAVNLDGAFLCTREAARRFIDQGSGGSMIIVSSMVTKYGSQYSVAYAASKSGLLGLGRTLAVDLAKHRVRCNFLNPGWTRTDMNSEMHSDERFVKVTTARTPARRWAEPEDFHQVACFLADPTQTFHTGNEVVVDGGYSVF